MDTSIEAATMLMKSDIPADPLRRRLWIIAELQVVGSSLAAIAREHGVTPQAVSNALRIPSIRFEQAIAAKLDRPVQHLFPERYLPDGTRNCLTRSEQSEAA